MQFRGSNNGQIGVDSCNTRLVEKVIDVDDEETNVDWQNDSDLCSEAPFTRYNLLLNRLSIRLYNPV